MKTTEKIALVISIIVFIVSLVALNNTMYKLAYKEGFRACIEENNLYERYNLER